MKKNTLIFILTCFSLSAQQTNVIPVRDAFIGIATDAIAAGQGDIGVATSADAFSQSWNPSKYVFSDKKFEIGITRILVNSEEFNEFNQLNLNFYNKPNTRSAYSISFRGYSYSINTLQFVQSNLEGSLDGAYTLRLGETFAMSVGGRYILLQGKAPLLDGFDDTSSLYGVDVSGFYYGNEIAYKKFNGRWRAGFNFSNVRGKSLNDNKSVEIYAPSTLRVGTGFDFVFNQDKILGITTEYKTLLDSYVENANREKLDFGLEGSVIALGLAFAYQEKLILRTGYSYGINRPTDSFASIGTGVRGRYVDIDVAFLLGVVQAENPIRSKLRLSLSLDLAEVL